MYDSEMKFLNFIATRPLPKIEQWAETIVCPVIRIDGTEDWRINAANIAERFLLDYYCAGLQNNKIF